MNIEQSHLVDGFITVKVWDKDPNVHSDAKLIVDVTEQNDLAPQFLNMRKGTPEYEEWKKDLDTMNGYDGYVHDRPILVGVLSDKERLCSYSRDELLKLPADRTLHPTKVMQGIDGNGGFDFNGMSSEDVSRIKRLVEGNTLENPSISLHNGKNSITVRTGMVVSNKYLPVSESTSDRVSIKHIELVMSCSLQFLASTPGKQVRHYVTGHTLSKPIAIKNNNYAEVSYTFVTKTTYTAKDFYSEGAYYIPILFDRTNRQKNVNRQLDGSPVVEEWISYDSYRTHSPMFSCLGVKPTVGRIEGSTVYNLLVKNKSESTVKYIPKGDDIVVTKELSEFISEMVAKHKDTQDLSSELDLVSFNFLEGFVNVSQSEGRYDAVTSPPVWCVGEPKTLTFNKELKGDYSAEYVGALMFPVCYPEAGRISNGSWNRVNLASIQVAYLVLFEKPLIKTPLNKVVVTQSFTPNELAIPYVSNKPDLGSEKNSDLKKMIISSGVSENDIT